MIKRPGTKFLATLCTSVVLAIALLLSPACKTIDGTYGLLDGEEAQNQEELKELVKAQVLPFIVMAGGVATHPHPAIDRTLEFVTHSSFDSVRKVAAGSLMHAMQFLKVDHLEAGVQQESGRPQRLTIGTKFQSSDLVQAFMLSRPSSCPSNPEHQFLVCDGYDSCLDSLNILEANFLQYRPYAHFDILHEVLATIEADISCFSDLFFHRPLTFKLDSVRAASRFYHTFNFGEIDGSRPARRPQASTSDHELKIEFEALEEGAYSSFLPHLDPFRLRDDIYLDFQCGAAVALESVGSEICLSEDRADKLLELTVDIQEQISDKITAITQAVISAHQNNVARLQLIKRANDRDPRAWLQDITQAAQRWMLATQRNQTPGAADLHPLLGLHTLLLHRHQEMLLPFRSEWLQSAVRLNGLRTTGERQPHLEALIAEAKAIAESTTTQTKNFFESQLANYPDLVHKERDIALRFSDFNSLYYTISEFWLALAGHHEAQQLYQASRATMTTQERGSLDHPSIQQAAEAERPFLTSWLNMACFNQLVNRPDEPFVQLGEPSEPQGPGCWESIGFDWQFFSTAPHPGQRPMQCIANNGQIDLLRICNAGQPESVAQLQNSISSCLRGQEVYQWCEGQSAKALNLASSIGAIGFTIATAKFIGPAGGFIARAALMGTTFTVANRAISASFGLRTIRDPEKSLLQDYGTDIAISTAFFMAISPMIAVYSRAALSVSGASYLPRSVLFRKVAGIGTYHGLTAASFMGISYATPHLLAGVYGVDPSQLGADQSFRDRLTHVFIFQTIIAAFSRGMHGQITERARASVQAQRATEFKSGQLLLKYDKTVGQTARLHNPGEAQGGQQPPRLPAPGQPRIRWQQEDLYRDTNHYAVLRNELRTSLRPGESIPNNLNTLIDARIARLRDVQGHHALNIQARGNPPHSVSRDPKALQRWIDTNRAREQAQIDSMQATIDRLTRAKQLADTGYRQAYDAELSKFQDLLGQIGIY